ncbi:MAG: 3-hydroxyacyl-CoA dehydrogenase NAD-binding domain-containing protein [Bacteroidia bacterium]
MNRIIRKVAVLRSGVMGSRIAAHFANIGCRVFLLDIFTMVQYIKKTARYAASRSFTHYNSESKPNLFTSGRLIFF